MPKQLIWLGMFVGSLIGGYVPTLWGDTGFFSMTSIFTTAIGGILGIMLAVKLTR